MGEQGHYVQVGDVSEWVWDEGQEPKVSVPKGEFDPHDPKPEPEKPKATKAEKPKAAK